MDAYVVRRWALGALGALSFLLTAFPAAANAYTTVAGYAAQDYVTGLAASPTNHWGPLGIAFDQSDNLYVVDNIDASIYRFQPGGGVASDATRLNSSPIAGGLTGLAVDRSGDLYLARYSAGDVVQIDPGTGEVLRTVARVACATGLAVDPISGDLFVSQNECGKTIWRVSGFANGRGKVSAYASASGVDGMVFDRDGSLYAESSGTVLRIDGTSSSTPGAVTDVAFVPHGDGLAFGAHATGGPPYLVVNRQDGIVTRLDFGTAIPSQSSIFSGGTRGDFAAVDSRGCLYITQSASVVRISGTGTTCAFEPTTPTTTPPPPAVHIDDFPPRKPAGRVCVRLQSVKFRLRQQGRVRLRSATVYVNGKRVKTLKDRAVTAPFVLTRLPNAYIRLEVVAITTHGKKLTTHKSYANCHKPPPPPRCTSTARFKVLIPRARGERIVRTWIYFDRRRIKVAHGHSLTSVLLRNLPHHRFTLSVVTWDSKGKRKTTRRTVIGCPLNVKVKAKRFGG